MTTTIARPRRRGSADSAEPANGAGSLSLLWVIFAVNAALFAIAVALLALTPASVHEHIRLDELVTLIVGASVLLAVDLMLLRRSLRPLRDLAAVMAAVDPMQPGRRAARPSPARRSFLAGARKEVVVLSDAFNDMLDRLETERRESARRELLAQEGERLRVARELHDEVGQSLTFVALRAEHAIERPPTQPQALDEISQAARVMLQDVQRIARELRPEALDDLGLPQALLALCSRTAAWSGTHVERDVQEEVPPLPADVELVIYRVGQEALTNAVRHSRAATVTMSLRCDGRRVTLSVRDDGTGMPVGSQEGNGIAGMRERAVLVGAGLEVLSVADEGVEVRLTIDRVRGE